MTGGPPGSDRSLDVRQAALAIESGFPDLAPARVERLGEGWDSEAFRVNDAWVFRFPKRRDVGELVEREAAVLALVADTVSVRVPRVERIGVPGPHFPYRFGGYRLIPGVGGDALPDVLGPEAERRIASALGRALTELHSVDSGRAVSLGVGVGAFEAAARLDHARQVAPALAGLLPEDAYRDYVAVIGGAAPPPAASALRRFTHNDLGVEHLLFDPSTLELTGIIDFADVAINDPAIDFVTLYHWRGEQFARDVLGHYRLATDAGFLDRVRFDAVVASGIWLTEAAAYSTPADVEKHQRWFARSIAPALRRLG